VRTPALHLIACEIFDEILLFAQLSPRIRMKWESDDDLNRARDDLVSGNALLGAFYGIGVGVAVAVLAGTITVITICGRF